MVRLIRVLRFDGSVLRFADNANPAMIELLPVADACKHVAASVEPMRLCKATVLGGQIVDLVPMNRRPLPS